MGKDFVFVDIKKKEGGGRGGGGGEGRGGGGGGGSSMLVCSNDKHLFLSGVNWKFGTRVPAGQVLVRALAGHTVI